MKTKIALCLFLLASCQQRESYETTVEKRKEHFVDGKLKWEVEIENGLKNGIYREFYHNGNLKYTGYFINDLINDTVKAYYENGALKGFQVWKDGFPDGAQKVYDAHGKMIFDLFHQKDSTDISYGRITYAHMRNENFPFPEDFILFGNETEIKPQLKINDGHPFVKGDTNILEVKIPNLPNTLPSVQNAIILPYKYNTYKILVNENTDTLKVFLRCNVNDTLLHFKPLFVPLK